MSISLINRVKEATLVAGYSNPAQFVIPLLEKGCDEVLGKRDNPNPEAQRLVEINREIGEISGETGDLIFGITSRSEKEKRWLAGLEDAYTEGDITKKQYQRLKKKIKGNIAKVSDLTYERSKLRDKIKKKRSRNRIKRITRSDVVKELKKRKRREERING